jgi:hypothetical protein
MSEPEAVRYEHTLQIDSQFAGRLIAAIYRYQVLTPGRLIRMLLPGLLVAAALSLTVNPPGLATAGVFMLVLLAFLVLYALVFVVSYFPTRRQLRERLPVGSEYSIALTDTVMRLKDPKVSTEVSYSLFKSVRETKDLVALIPKRGRRPTLVPAGLLTPDALAWLTARLEEPA